jgi:hypothetical protein
MSEQFVLLFFTHGVCQIQWQWNAFLEKIISKVWGKNHLTVYVDNKYACAKSILWASCNKAITSKFDFQTHTQVCVVANKAQKERCHVKILIHVPHPCRLSSLLPSSSKTFI